jgi:alkylation response protein AidB-like acyl-CoA dehydrogenase
VRLTSEQEDLRGAVRALLGRCRLGPEPDPAAERALWQRLCAEIGVAGLGIPERYGGAGAGPLEVHVVMEELGRLLVPSPMLGSAVLATQALLGSQDEAACARLLPALAEGREVAALAWTTVGGRWDPADVACQAGRPEGTAAGEAAEPGNWLVTGEAHYVLDGSGASVLLVPAVMPDGGTGLFEVRPGQPTVTCSPCATMDDTRRLAVVTLDGATARRIGGPAALDRARDAACIALSAEQVGAAAQALALTVAYAKVRVQFGRPIGAFQALQHRMAEMHVLAESARSLSYAAAEALQQQAPDVGLRAAAAKAYCSEALQRVSAEMIQLHGAIGMTWEHQAHRYFKRGHGAAMLLGTPPSHTSRIAAAVIDG